MSVTTPIIAVMLAQRNKVIRNLRQAGALSAQTAVPANTIYGFGRREFDHLVQLEIVRVLGNDTAYLVENKLAEWKELQRGRARLILAVATVVALGLTLLAYYLNAGG